MPLDRRTFLQLLGLAPALPLAAKLRGQSGPVVAPRETPPLAWGLREQLLAHNRVVDLQGEKLAVSYLGEVASHMHGVRRMVSPESNTHVIDLAMSHRMHDEFRLAMADYYLETFGFDQNDDTCWKKFTSTPAIAEDIPCTVCDYPRANVQLAAIEMLAKESTAMWILDWSDLYFGIRSTNSEAGHPEAHLIIENIGGFSHHA